MRSRSCLAAMAVALSCATSLADGPPPARRFQVVLARPDGVMATGINGKGDTVGFLWVESKEHQGVLDQSPFYCTGKTVTAIPPLQGYTAVFPYAVSDGGTVVGRVSKPSLPGQVTPLRNQAFVWDAAGGIRGLGTLEGDSASLATDISRDGRRIAGFSIGDNRVRACYWDRRDDGWKVMRLAQRANLGSNVVVMSDDGKVVAAVDGQTACRWTQRSENEWKEELITPAVSLIPRGVNNEGTVVGVRFTPDGLTHAVVWTRDGGAKVLDLPEGYVRAEANAVNNRGVVVGMIDGPHGSKVAPRAFAYEAGNLRIIEEGGPDFSSATDINDRDQVTGVLDVEEDEEKPGFEAKPGSAKPARPPAGKAESPDKKAEDSGGSSPRGPR
ncbi:hypothetical protein OJF2_13140 [Aquisphaera giovannonii]|uniref:Uncharacterized protein n=1 Tax=Aquisphaera giovannonii TaxID=406548 RepID=A0A5B9VYX2_9BACT|nr:HAF repeat-containing protein [Aquisphaera giovannonii]QEH32830.1 hypothetical protein OJF2_13140 [Aquisphaera giovannonii]